MTNALPKLPALWLKLLTALIYILSICFIAGGVWNAILGGPYIYIVTGTLLLVTAILFSRRSAVGLVVYGLFFIGISLWTLSTVGIDIWRVFPRLDIFLVLAFLMFIPKVNRPLYPNTFAFIPAILGTVVSLGICVAGLIHDPMDVKGSLPDKLLHPLPKVSAEIPNSDWTSFARTSYGDHFSPVDIINKDNVSRLKTAWSIHTGDLPLDSDPAELTNEATPLSLGGQLYLCTAHQKLFSIDGKTGEIKWTFDPHLDAKRSFQHLTCRGVSQHVTPENALTSTGDPTPKECPTRIMLGTNDGRLFALDAETGEQCHSFGHDGVVDLRFSFQPNTKAGEFEPTSPALIAGNLAIVNGAVTDNYSTNEASGVTRAYDVYTGRLVWVFDGANQNPNEMPGSVEHPHYRQNSPNSWSISSYDPELNLVYMPMGIGTPDQWGGGRDADFERFAPGIVALNASNGHVVWSFRNIHHDLWDQDAPSQPVLMDTTDSEGVTRKAVYLPTKGGDIFVLDRETGEPIVPIKELPAPSGAVTGDWTSATQPASDLSLRPKVVTDNDIWGGSLLDQMICTGYFHSLKYEGPWTPPSLQGSLIYPGNLGIFEWGGISIDPRKQTAFANLIEMPFVSQLMPRNKHNPIEPEASAEDKKGGEVGIQPNYGAPYGVSISPFMNPWMMKLGIKVPCHAPPWGENVGIDLTNNKVVWRHRNGTIQDSMQEVMPLPPLPAGVPSIGGSLTTAGGLTFVSGTQDNYIRAYDTQTGKKLWQARLPAGGQATPMSYELDGKQYIVVYAGGHGSFGSRIGDNLIAYSLPDRGIE